MCVLNPIPRHTKTMQYPVADLLSDVRVGTDISLLEK